MGADIRIDGKPYWNAGAFSVTEEATPLDPSDSTGAVGQFTVAIPPTPETKLVRQKRLDLEDGTRGTTVGTIRSLAVTPTATTLTADSRLSALNVVRQVNPVNGTFEQAILYYLGLCGITTAIFIDEDLKQRPFISRGWNANVWDELKKMATARQFEISLVSDNIVVRKPRAVTAVRHRDSQVSFSLDDTDLAQSVEVYWYEKTWRNGYIAYPEGGWDDEVQVINVDAGETIEMNIPLKSSLISLEQPVAVSRVDRDHVNSSVYAVSGNDGKIIPPAQWLDGGGSLTVSIGEDLRSIDLKIVGSSEELYAPFKIAMPSGPSDFYSSLRIVGTGVFVEENLLTYLTGLDNDTAPNEIGATIKNENIGSYEDAFRMAMIAGGRFSGGQQAISVTTNGINRAGETGSYRYPTLDEADAEYGARTLAGVDALWPTQTLDQVSDWWIAKVRTDFANQAFGNIAGARVFDDGAVYRIRSATTSPSSISHRAERDVLLTDADQAWATQTLAAMDVAWAGLTLDQVDVRPLAPVT
jgi:hypothetical protein